MLIRLPALEGGTARRVLASLSALLLLGFLLAACTPGSSAMSDSRTAELTEPLMLLGDERTKPREGGDPASDHLVVNGSFRTFDGVELPLRAWLP